MLFLSVQVLKRHFEYLTRKVDAHRNKQNAAAGQFLQPHVSHSRAEKAVKFLTDRTPNPTDIIQRFPAPSSHVSGRKVEGTSGEKRRLLRSPMRDDTRGGGGKASVSGPVRRGGEDALGKLPSTNLVDIGPALQKSASNASLSSSTAHRGVYKRKQKLKRDHVLEAPCSELGLGNVEFVLGVKYCEADLWRLLLQFC